MSAIGHPLTRNLVLQKARVDREAFVRKLNLSNVGIDDIAVLEKFTALEVVSLSANDVSDLAALSACPRLREVFLRKNDVVDLFQVLHLRGLEELQTLTLSENPITSHDCYRRYVISALPQISMLDDQAITTAERESARTEFPDVTACEIPMPLPTKREMHGNKSGSPHLQRRGTPLGGAAPGSASFSPPNDPPSRPSAGGSRQSPSAADVPSGSATPPEAVITTAAAAAPRTSANAGGASAVARPRPQRHDDSSDVHTDGSEDPLARRGDPAVDRDNRPAGVRARAGAGQRPQPSAAVAGRHADPAVESPAEDDELGYQDSMDSAPEDGQPRGAPRRTQAPRTSGVRAGAGQGAAARGGARPGIPLSPAPIGIREENVVRAVNMLLGELSPAGLDAVRRQLDMLDMR